MHWPALEKGTCMKIQFFNFCILFHAFTRSRAGYMHEKSIAYQNFMHLPVLEQVTCMKNKSFFIQIEFHAFIRSRARYMHEKSIFLYLNKISPEINQVSKRRINKTKSHKIAVTPQVSSTRHLFIKCSL